MGMAATSAMVAMQAIQDAWSAETEKAPPMSAIARSTSWDEMLDPTMAIVTMPIVWIATERGGGPAGLGPSEAASGGTVAYVSVLLAKTPGTNPQFKS